jgi:hypothetical protein
MRDRLKKMCAVAALVAMAPFAALWALALTFSPKPRPRRNEHLLLGGIALCMLAVVATLPMVGCSGTSVAQNIVNWVPPLENGIAVVDTTASVLLPADAPIFAAATAGFDAAAGELVTQAKAYLATPNATVLARLQTAVITLNQTVNAALLKAAGIKDPGSQQHALSALQAVAAVVSAILAAVMSISGKTAVAQMAAQSTIKLAQTPPLLDPDEPAHVVAAHYEIPLWIAAVQVDQAQRSLQAAGF